ncbi:MAG: glycosyltransferase family 4 protein [Patescibacteria group bacterium]|jgi:glycosyltransferase involved in cell wall biosynthesis
MKIAIVTPTFPPYAGGIGNVAAFNAKELVRLGYQVTIFTPFYQAVEEEFSDLDIKRVKPLFKYGNAAFVPALGWMLKGYDIIHLHYPFFGGAEVIWFYWRRFKKQKTKIILHYHMDVVGEGIFKLIFKIHNWFVLPRIVKKADKVIFTSLDYGQHSNLAKKIGKNPAKFVELPNGVDTQNFSPQAKDSELLRKHEINFNDKVVLFVGGLDKAHYFKGVEYLIEGASRLRQENYEWKLVIVGEGELKQTYVDLVHQLKIHLRTVFTGYVPNEDLPKYYNLADVVVLPSVDKSEAFGLALIEGMSCAKPVVASNLVGVRSVITEKMDGLLAEPKNPDDLAAKINYFLDNPSQALEFGRAGRRKVLLKYDWRIIGQQLDELYKKL